MLLRSSFLNALALGLLTSLISNAHSAGWWQLLILALFWRLIDRHHFHGGAYQAKLGWCFGFAYFGHSLWWIYVSLHDVGGMPFWMASTGVVIFAGF